MSSSQPTTTAAVEEMFAAQAARFHTLAADCRLSFLEVKLYRKYFVEANPKTPERLARLSVIVDALAQHRTNTIAVLKAIHEREAIIDALHAQVERIANAPNRNASILDFQSDGLHLIYLHQQVTLRVVEAVENWRRPLTRPFPFVHQNENYFAKVLADCQALSASSLGKILPVKLAQYPLCSDLPSLCLFVTANPAATVARGGAKHPPTRMTSEMAAKIQSAQAVLLEEIDTQKRLLRELEGLSAAGFFLPVLNMHSIIPSSSTGIRMSNHEWEGQLRDAIAVAKEDLELAEERAMHAHHSPSAAGTQHHGGAGNGRSGAGAADEDRGGAFAGSGAAGRHRRSDSDSSSSSSSSSSSAAEEEQPHRHSSSSDHPSGAKRVSIDEKARPQPEPPRRPTSALKRSETPDPTGAAAAKSATAAAGSSSRTPTPTGSARPAAPVAVDAQLKKQDYDEDGFEKDDEL